MRISAIRERFFDLRTVAAGSQDELQQVYLNEETTFRGRDGKCEGKNSALTPALTRLIVEFQ